MYRIISGKWKGKRISAPKNLEVRPTTDYAKEALFSILVHRFDLEFISVLDLFAGLGSISLEFASRNCKDITAVELDRKHCTFIHKTMKELEVENQINLLNYNAFDYLKKGKNHGKTFNIIFADPPFSFSDEDYEILFEEVLKNDFLAENGVLIVEHQSKRSWEHPKKTETRKYGNVSFSFFEK